MLVAAPVATAAKMSPLLNEVVQPVRVESWDLVAPEMLGGADAVILSPDTGWVEPASKFAYVHFHQSKATEPD